METNLQDLIELSLGSSPERMLEKALDICIRVSGATGGSILGEEGPFLQFLFSDVPDLIGVRVPFDSIAGATVRRSVVIYTFAPRDDRHFTGVDMQTQSKTQYLLSIPIPSIHQSSSETSRRNAGALQLLFGSNVCPELPPDDYPYESSIDAFRNNELCEKHFGEIFRILPNVAFGMEVVKLRQTSYQAIHELKNKLISAQSWLNYLRDDIRKQSPDILEDSTVCEDFDLATASIKEGAQLAKSYLQFTQIYQPDFAQANVNEVLRDVAASTEALAHEYGGTAFRVLTDLDASVPDREIDSDKLKMAFFNLCKNATEALIELGTKEPAIRISSIFDGNNVTVTVSDNGPGMPAGIAENLFIPFKTRKEGGTGLGLTITKKIIDIHNGQIECKTGPGGTSFTVKL